MPQGRRNRPDRVSVKAAVIFIFVGLALLSALNGQSPAPGGWGSQTIQLKYVEAEQVRRVFSGQSYLMQVDYRQNSLTVRGPRAFVTDVEETAKKLDVAPPVPKNIEITVYLVSVVATAVELPADLTALDKEIKATMGVQPFRVVDSQVIRVRSGTSGNATSLGPQADGLATFSSFRFQSATIIPGNALALNGLQLGLNIPAKATSTPPQPGAEIGIAADLDLLENQPTIVRKAGIDKPLIVIVRAKVI
jgi:type II secretory pathway component GspD/PulD (secretin)